MFQYPAQEDNQVTTDAAASFWMQRFCARVDIANSIMQHRSDMKFPAAMEVANDIMHQQFTDWLSQP